MHFAVLQREARMARSATAAVAGTLALLLASGLGVSARAATPGVSADEAAIWDLERAYWRYVQSNDLQSYSGLWNEAFLGWPSVSATPVSKEHITDWITSQTSQGRSEEHTS